ncbi:MULTISPECIES: arylsulfatase [unclassified Mesorhizobium]|uniref:arylsulfatase n=1 Tax=unclassified Mesorhizobium TaxID=325217 RepID=UPI000FD8CF81|nr:MULTISPECIES: arylsulfatase [unclassified Mesorhizobium]TGQ16777.1 arylsulfatase [Mesorhizobium sp. M2E.F.Ca.ET.219.01.1.1]TGT77130.1 arylsulfatase [Mesorhizobium sp. M2E.F.Ca.ET.166.01.1.1]TGW03238.1 arylsulfatase [Mesorhizobium sp. M2E.F.Ca.ET.154.01.1.1]
MHKKPEARGGERLSGLPIRRRDVLLGAASALTISAMAWGLAEPATAESQKKPNILIIWGDDIGWWNISAYNQGMMGYKTPNIDSIAKEGALFTDYYGQQSCTAGRAAFITGQTPFRTGMLKVGLPGAKEGLQPEDPTLADLLKAQGYMTGQFGKNHLGDRDEHLPTAHGFDEFFGSLYHLNAEDEPEHPDYFKDPEMQKKYGTRGVIHCWANPDGTQKIESTGPLTKKRMETIDAEVTEKALDFMQRAKDANKPFFLWWNSTRMHIWTRLKKESEGKTGLGIYPDGMVEHDGQVGQVLEKLKALGLDDNTIVMYSTDNGAEKFTWPDGGQSPFRGEKNTNWEGGYRVPAMVRWPGVVKPGTILNDIVSHEDWIPTLMAAVGEPDIGEKLKAGLKVGKKTYKVHLDGYNQMDYFAGKGPDPRHEFFYFNDDGSLVALRYDQWKLVFAEQRGEGFEVWEEPFVPLRLPKLFNLRSDPFETADHEGMDYDRWRVEHVFLLVPAQQYVGKFLATFKEFPPRQKPGSFSIDQVLASLTAGSAGTGAN